MENSEYLQADVEQGDVTPSITVGPDQCYFGPTIKFSGKAKKELAEILKGVQYRFSDGTIYTEQFKEEIEQIERIVNSQEPN